MMLKYAWCVYFLVALLFPALTLVAGTRKIICEGAPVEKCYKKVGKEPVVRPNCKTKKGWVYEKKPNCGKESQNPIDSGTVKAAGEPKDSGVTSEGDTQRGGGSLPLE
jgi:hypothetical protein